MGVKVGDEDGVREGVCVGGGGGGYIKIFFIKYVTN